MSKETLVLPPSRSWRDIPQHVKPRAMSREGRRRVTFGMMRTVGSFVAFGLILWVAWLVASSIRGGTSTLTDSAKSDPVRHLRLVTDGVLDNGWLTRILALPKDATLMGVDLLALRERVLAEGQVSSAAIIRNFPDTLTVRVTERTPVARIMAQLPGESPRPFLLARDGVSFGGTGFDPGMISGLPWIDGVKLARKGSGFAPIEGMDVAGDLLAMAKLEAEPLYRTWQVVSLAHLAPDREVEVRTRDGVKVLFGADEDYLRQLARLDLLLESASGDSAHPLREVNLALGSEVPVAYGSEQAPVARKEPLAAAPKGLSIVIPSLQP
jgi:hypothetical protein